jgi:hypothetical protein
MAKLDLQCRRVAIQQMVEIVLNTDAFAASASPTRLQAILWYQQAQAKTLEEI